MRCNEKTPCSNHSQVGPGSLGLPWVPALALMVVLAQPVLSQSLYWDLNGSANGSGGPAPSGVWDATTPNWNLNSAGTGTLSPWNSGNTAVFSAGTDATGQYTLTLSGAQTASGLTFEEGSATLVGDGLTLTSPSLVAVNAAAKGIIAVVVSGTSGLTKASSGELVLSGANLFTGNLTNRAGILTLDHNAAAGAGLIVVDGTAAATLRSTQPATTLANDILLRGTGPAVELNALAGNTLTLSGVIGGSRNWTANGPGKLVLTGAAGNTFPGAVTVAQGTLVVAKSGALGSTLNGTVVNSGATLAFDGGYEYYAAEQVTLNGPGFAGGAALNNLSGDNIFDGTVTLAANSIIGADADSLTLVGAISGNYNLTKVGPGAVDLTALNNTYNQTLVSQGILGVWYPSSAGTGLVTVNLGARLEGNGSVPGGVALSGTIAPGASPDTLDTGTQTWNPGASYDWDINDAAGAAGSPTGWDLLNITGTLTLNATPANPATVRIFSLDPNFNLPDEAANFDNTQDYAWVIATTTGGITGFDPASVLIDDSGFENAKGNGTFVLELVNSNKDLVLKFIHPPFIVVQPAAATKECGTEGVTFTVVAGGTGTLSYQWQKNGGDISGATSSAYSITPVALADSGTYKVVITNDYGSITSADAVLTVQDTLAPSITCPANVTVNADAGLCYATGVALGTPATSDACGVATVVNDAPVQFPVGVTTVTWTVTDTSNNSTTCTQAVTVVDNQAPSLACQSLSITLDTAGNYTLSAAEIASLITAASDNCGLAATNVSQTVFNFCHVGSNPVTVTVTDVNGNPSTCNTTINVSAPAAAPAVVYVDDDYSSACAAVTFPSSGGTGTYYVGYNAFPTIQAAVTAVADGGTVNVAAGFYEENVAVTKAATILGPNAGKAGSDPARGPEAVVTTALNDPESVPVFSVEADHVMIDGFLLDGHNPNLSPELGDYDANGVVVHAPAAVQNGAYPNLTDELSHLTVQNNIIRNFSYDGIYLELPLGTDNGWNYIGNNLFDTMWEGLQTYAVHAVVTNNTFISCNRGLSLHGVTSEAPAGFSPRVAGNVLTIAEWWPDNQLPDRVNADGIWVNYRRQNAAELNVVGNIINTPVAAPAGKRIRGLFALTIDGEAKVNFIDNTVNGQGYCLSGVYVSGCWSNGAVKVLGGTLDQIKTSGVLAQTLDPDWGTGDAFVTVSNVTINMAAGGIGVLASQDATTPTLTAEATLTGTTAISGGATGVSALGSLAKVTFLAASPAASLGGMNDYIVLDSNGATFANTPVDATSVLFDGKLGADMTLAELFATEDKIQHQLDNAALGLVRVKAANLYVTPNSGSIQRGIDAAAIGDTVHVAAGNFTENLVLNKRVVLDGMGSGNSPAADTIVTSAAANLDVLNITASGASASDRLVVKDLRLTGATGSGNAACGIELAAAGSYYTFENVASVGNGGHGLAQNFIGSNSDVLVTGCSLSDNGGAGFHIPPDAGIDGLEIVNSSLNNNTAGFEAYRADGSPELLRNVTITDCAFNSNSSKGIYAEKLSDAVLQRLTLSASGSSGSFAAGIDLNLKYGTYQNIQVLDSEILNCGTGDMVNGAGVTIKARDDGAYAANPATLTGVTLSGLIVAGSPDGIRFGEPAGNNAGPSSVAVHQCNLTGNLNFAIRNESQTLADASLNWWGAVSGPSNPLANPYGTGAAVSANVAFAPWLGDGTDTSTDLGFQPNLTPAYNPPVQLAFTAAPGTTDLGSLLAPQPVVAVQDANGNTTPWANPLVSLAIGNNPGSGVLAGTSAQTATAGVASFTDLAIMVGGGAGYTLVASAPNLASATSTAFDINNPAPTLSSLSPFWKRAGDPDFSLTINGGNFVPNSVVHWNGAPRTTHFVSASQLTADISAADIASPGTAQVKVVSEAPGGGQTAELTFRIEAAVPAVVYVDDDYFSLPTDSLVSWPYAGAGTNIIGYNAFDTIQGGVDAVATGGSVYVAAGNYVENVVVPKALNLIGPNAGMAGAGGRQPEAVVRPAINDPESVPIVSVEAENIVIDGFLFDGHNPGLAQPGDYDANGVPVHAPAAIQNGNYPLLVAFNQVTIQNNIITNIAYDGVYLELPLGADNGWNYVGNNKFANCWEGLQTYAVHSVITNNTFESCNLGLSLHGTITAAPAGFSPLIASNILTIAEWWPDEQLPDRMNAQGIWINYRRDNAAELNVVGNVIQTPADAPPGKTIRGIYALTVDGNGKVNLIDNTVNGQGHCDVGVYVTACWSNGAVNVLGGTLANIKAVGVRAATLDAVWGAGNAFVTVSNVNINVAGTGLGVQALQDAATPANQAGVTVIGNTAINGAAVGVKVEGPLAWATVKNNPASISFNAVGVGADGGKALVENNNLAGNTLAAIQVENGGVVDAGDCLGANVTGLGTGSGVNGSSSGLNKLTGYSFNNAAPWAIRNLNVSGPAVLAYNNNFGATAGDDIRLALEQVSPVEFTQSGGLLLNCPAPVTVQCVTDVPAGAADLPQFFAQGGIASCSPGTVSFTDSTYPVGSGVITRTYTVTDPCGATTTCQQLITVADVLKPVVLCPPDITQPTDAGQCYATVAITDATATDNCAVASVVGARSDSQPLSATYPKGVTTITWTATDTSGNTEICNQTITVVDQQPPTITAPANLTVNTDTNVCYATGVALGTPTTWDNCAIALVTNDAPAQFPKGVTPVTWTVTDTSGLTATATQLVTVLDGEPPTIACPPDTVVQISESRDPYVTGLPTASDNCGGVTVTYNDNRSGLTGCNATGTLIRTWRATDEALRPMECQQTIQVVDAKAPLFALVPANITVANDPGLCSAVVNYPAPTAFDPGFSQDFENPAWVGGLFPASPSLDWNEYNSKIFRVPSGTGGIPSRSGAAHAVIDSTVLPPSPSDYTGALCRLGGPDGTFGAGFRMALDVYLDLNDPSVSAATPTTGYGWNLLCGASKPNRTLLRDFVFHTAAYGMSSSNGIVVAASLTTNGQRRNDLLSGAYYIVTNSAWYTFEAVFKDDGSGVLAVAMNLRDSSGGLLWTTTLSNPADLIASVVGGNYALWFDYIAVNQLPIDNTLLERNLAVACNIPSGTAFPVGTTTVTCTATDACGNSASTNFTVTVNDTEPPAVTCPATVIQPNTPGLCSAVVTFAPVATDNCPGSVTVTTTPASGSVFPVGTTPVLVTAVDSHNNTNTCVFNVVVQDAEAPSLTCPDPVVKLVPFGYTFANVTFPPPTVSDNCGLFGYSVNPAPGSMFPVGTNTVQVTAWDVANNTNTCTFTVAVVPSDPTPAVQVLTYTNSTAVVEVIGISGYPVVLEASTNLFDWTAIQTNLVPYWHVDTQSPAFSQRFYRAKFVP